MNIYCLIHLLLHVAKTAAIEEKVSYILLTHIFKWETQYYANICCWCTEGNVFENKESVSMIDPLFRSHHSLELFKVHLVVSIDIRLKKMAQHLDGSGSTLRSSGPTSSIISVISSSVKWTPRFAITALISLLDANPLLSLSNTAQQLKIMMEQRNRTKKITRKSTHRCARLTCITCITSVTCIT